MNYKTRLADLFLAPVLSSHELSGIQKQDFVGCTMMIPTCTILSDWCFNEFFWNKMV